MPRLERDGGVELFFEEHGDGPLVVVAPHWFGLPRVFGPLIEDLAADHHVVRYDARGTGKSSRVGPYDAATAAGDLAAVAESYGGGAVLIGILDAANDAMCVAAEHPDLATAVVSVASFPAALSELDATESMIGSDKVIETFIEMLETDYRGAFRSVTTAGNPQMSEDEIRERVRAQVEYCPHEVALARLRESTRQDPLAWATALGARLHLVYSPEIAGAWFPPFEEMRPLLAKLVPEADVQLVDDGIISRPGLTAAIVREATGVERVAK